MFPFEEECDLMMEPRRGPTTPQSPRSPSARRGGCATSPGVAANGCRKPWAVPFLVHAHYLPVVQAVNRYYTQSDCVARPPADRGAYRRRSPCVFGFGADAAPPYSVFTLLIH